MAAEHRLEPSRKRTSTKWLGYEVVGAQLEHAYLVILIAFGRQHHDRDIPGGGPGAELLQHAIAIESREVQIQNDDVGGKPVDFVEGLDPVPGFGHLIALPLQQIFHHPAQLLLVFYQEDTGTLSPTPGQRPVIRSWLLEQLHVHGELDQR